MSSTFLTSDLPRLPSLHAAVTGAPQGTRMTSGNYCHFVQPGWMPEVGSNHNESCPDAADLAVSLAALEDWTFLLGPGFIVGWGNGLILG
jgi:hypothetical protein